MKEASFVSPISPMITHMICILFFSFLVGKSCGVDDLQFLRCRVPQNCGDGQNITFPFFIQGTQRENYSCGHPGFPISCNINGQPTFTIVDSNYTIHQIFYKNQTLRISNAIFSNSNTDCIPLIKNIPFPLVRFELEPKQSHLHLFPNCSSKSSLLRSDLHFYAGCSGEKVLALSEEDPRLGNVSKECTTEVVAPVEAAYGGENHDEIRGALGNGFWLKWKAAECSYCEDSGGFCGSELVDNSGNDRFLCFCADRPHHVRCQIPERNRHKLAIAFGVVCPVIFFIMICVFFIIRHHYKKKYASSTMLAKNANSDPSSRSDLEGGSVYYGVPVYSYSELEEATNNFDTEKELGDGGFGIVYYGKLRDGREVAVKRLYEHNYRRVAQFMNEVEILTRLRHKNLVSLYGCTSHRSRQLLLVYEYIPNGTVADHIHGERATLGSLTWPTRMNIAIETATALAYLHASEIIHRDVKTNNILLDKNFCVKVADFGLSRLFPNDVSHVSTAPQGTPGYVDPEYHQCYQLTTKSDVYSFGVVLIELISSLPAVDIARHRHEINLANLAISKIEKSAFHELIDPHLGFESDKEVERMTILVAQLAFQCIQQDKETRPSMDEVLEALKQIQSGNDAPEDQEKGFDDDVVVNVKPPISPESDEVALLKTKQLPPSPISVNTNWTSRSTTPNISS
ncbi:LEAF RUST 10 DISEASE-RESISTANCE LOCUS RECEPTOR-LIKE PROTEIN KINASE-like 1.2 isoform X2 [Corylus avellana]|uniref:LEAF RUST 10 DISEASE-RESISTANCE LOCUS RECEPTOR-LIKE PROTEIN KINASE-like 1.2 isoform X2 n=1 Tax=Corylus avellana TaxID=13451 RepID=UPI00286A135C|nr:LEAF RUST 10 DISEASE-RESISTANCE LOCUS RECEPTOR-LIKE PROTEIN KINASE-like 1.2 isoform X2 [Corylus avellana]